MPVCLDPVCPDQGGYLASYGPCLDPCVGEAGGTSRSPDDAQFGQWSFVGKDGHAYEKLEPSGPRSDGPALEERRRGQRKDACGARARYLCCALTVALPACIASLMIYSIVNPKRDRPGDGSQEPHGPPSPPGRLPAIASAHAATYNCAGSYHASSSWLPAKRRWCCEHGHAGCAAVAARPAPKGAAPAAVPGGCETVCHFDSRSATCRVRIQFAAHYVLFSRPRACERARTLVLRECPACASCHAADAGCASPGPVAHASPGAAAVPAAAGAKPGSGGAGGGSS